MVRCFCLANKLEHELGPLPLVRLNSFVQQHLANLPEVLCSSPAIRRMSRPVEGRRKYQNTRPRHL